jgi:hypothetical protein
MKATSTTGSEGRAEPVKASPATAVTAPKRNQTDRSRLRNQRRCVFCRLLEKARERISEYAHSEPASPVVADG